LAEESTSQSMQSTNPHPHRRLRRALSLYSSPRTGLLHSHGRPRKTPPLVSGAETFGLALVRVGSQFLPQLLGGRGWSPRHISGARPDSAFIVVLHRRPTPVCDTSEALSLTWRASL